MKKIAVFALSMLGAIGIWGHEGNHYEQFDFFRNMREGDKAVILMVHFGTTHADTKAQTIDRLNAGVGEQFPGVELREAYTSRIVVKRLKDRGIVKQNPSEVLQRLREEGYTHVLVQPSTVIDGVEMEALHRDVGEAVASFKDIRVGTPLLYSPHDYERVIETLTVGYDETVAYVWVGHGTYDAATAQYAMLDYMLKSKGHANCFVGTIEGYPGYEEVLSRLKASGLSKVILVPFMFVAGEHAKNDIAGEWKERLQEAGFVVDVDRRGLGEYPGIQGIYIDHLRHAALHRKIDIMEKKKIYEQTGEKLSD